MVIDGNNDLEVGLSIEGLMVIDGNNDFEVGLSIGGFIVIDVSNNLEVSLSIEEPYKKGLPIRAFQIVRTSFILCVVQMMTMVLVTSSSKNNVKNSLSITSNRLPILSTLLNL